MSPYDNDALQKLLREVAQKRGFAPLSPEQAQAEYDAAPREPLSPEEIDRIVRHALAGKPPRRLRPTSPSYIEEESPVSEDMLVLNRNAGELDPETARKLDELRKSALAEDDDEDESRLED